MDASLESLRFPVGRFRWPKEVSADEIRKAIQTISDFPKKLEQAINGLNDAQLDTPYRPEGWTIRQVVHHVADSHMNAYIRFKLALTEENPDVKPYQQDEWAKLTDSHEDPMISIQLLHALHHRWVIILKNIKPEEWQRTLFHPEYKRTWILDQMLMMYDWHCRHHLAHVTSLIDRMGWR